MSSNSGKQPQISYSSIVRVGSSPSPSPSPSVVSGAKAAPTAAGNAWANPPITSQAVGKHNQQGGKSPSAASILTLGSSATHQSPAQASSTASATKPTTPLNFAAAIAAGAGRSPAKRKGPTVHLFGSGGTAAAASSSPSTSAGAAASLPTPSTRSVPLPLSPPAASSVSPPPPKKWGPSASAAAGDVSTAATATASEGIASPAPDASNGCDLASRLADAPSLPSLGEVASQRAQQQQQQQNRSTPKKGQQQKQNTIEAQDKKEEETKADDESTTAAASSHSPAPAAVDTTAATKGFAKLQSLFRRRLDPTFNQINPVFLLPNSSGDDGEGGKKEGENTVAGDESEKATVFPFVYITNLGGATAVFRNTAPYVTALSPLNDLLRDRNVRVVVTALSSRAEDSGGGGANGGNGGAALASPYSTTASANASISSLPPTPHGTHHPSAAAAGSQHYHHSHHHHSPHPTPSSAAANAPFNLGYSEADGSWEDYMERQQGPPHHHYAPPPPPPFAGGGGPMLYGYTGGGGAQSLIGLSPPPPPPPAYDNGHHASSAAASTSTPALAPSSAGASSVSVPYTGGDFYPQHFRRHSPTLSAGAASSVPSTPAPVFLNNKGNINNTNSNNVPASPPHAPLPAANVPPLPSAPIGHNAVTPHVLPAPPPLPSLPGGGLITATSTPALAPRGAWGAKATPTTAGTTPKPPVVSPSSAAGGAPSSATLSAAAVEPTPPLRPTTSACANGQTTATPHSQQQQQRVGSWAAKLALTPSPAPPTVAAPPTCAAQQPSPPPLPTLSELLGSAPALPNSSSSGASPPADHNKTSDNNTSDACTDAARAAAPPTAERIAELAAACPSIRVFLPTCPDYAQHNEDRKAAAGQQSEDDRLAFGVRLRPYPVYLRLTIPPPPQQSATTDTADDEATTVHLASVATAAVKQTQPMIADESEVARLLRIVLSHEEAAARAFAEAATKGAPPPTPAPRNAWAAKAAAASKIAAAPKPDDTSSKSANNDDNSALANIITIGVPFYYVHVPVEDNHTTRLPSFAATLAQLMGALSCPLLPIPNECEGNGTHGLRELIADVQRLLFSNHAAARGLLLRDKLLSISTGRPFSSTGDLRSLLAEGGSGGPPSAVVHCLQGISRSASIVLAFLMAYGNRPPAPAGGGGKISDKMGSSAPTSAVVSFTATSATVPRAHQPQHSTSESSEPTTYANALASLCACRPVVSPNPFFRAQLVRMEGRLAVL